MNWYVVERYLPGITEEELRIAAERLASAADVVTDEGAPVVYLGSTFVPLEEYCFSRFESASIRSVQRACDLARVPFARIVEACEHDPQTARRNL